MNTLMQWLAVLADQLAALPGRMADLPTAAMQLEALMLVVLVIAAVLIQRLLRPLGDHWCARTRSMGGRGGAGVSAVAPDAGDCWSGRAA